MQMSSHVQIAKEEPKWEADGAKSRKTGILIGGWIDAISQVGDSGCHFTPPPTWSGTLHTPFWLRKIKIKKSVSMNFDLAMAEESNADSRSLYQSLLDAVIYSNGRKKNPLTAPWFYFCAMHPSSQRTAGIPRVTGSTSSLELLSSFTAHSTQKTRCESPVPKGGNHHHSLDLMTSVTTTLPHKLLFASV